MARGINKVILIGNLGQDPEVKYTASGMAVVNLRLATTDQWTDKASGEKKDRTEWHSVVVYGKTAEVAGQYLKKGRQVFIEGRLQTRKWQDKEGKDRYTTEIVCNDMQMLGGPGGGGGGGGGGGADFDPQMEPSGMGGRSGMGAGAGAGAAVAAAPRAGGGARQAESEPFGGDDDIPF